MIIILLQSNHIQATSDNTAAETAVSGLLWTTKYPIIDR